MKDIVFILDVDGVLTDGTFLYDESGKRYKKFGPDDKDALKMIEKDVKIVFVSSDKRGYEISKRRVEDMGFQLECVNVKHRLNWIKTSFPKYKWHVIYMGDSFADAAIFDYVNLSFAPKNAHEYAKNHASIVLSSNGGERAVTDAVFYIILNVLHKNLDEEIMKIHQKA